MKTDTLAMKQSAERQTSSVPPKYVAWNSVTGHFFVARIGFHEPNPNHATRMTLEELADLREHYVNVESRADVPTEPKITKLYFVWNKRQIRDLVHQANRMHREATGKHPDMQSCFVIEAETLPGFTSQDGAEQIGHFTMRSAQGEKKEGL